MVFYLANCGWNTLQAVSQGVIEVFGKLDCFSLAGYEAIFVFEYKAVNKHSRDCEFNLCIEHNYCNRISLCFLNFKYKTISETNCVCKRRTCTSWRGCNLDNKEHNL
jgi:hypothetical protein